MGIVDIASQRQNTRPLQSPGGARHPGSRATSAIHLADILETGNQAGAENRLAMNNPVIVAHYHELWLKGRNRQFFFRKLAQALRQVLQGIPVERIEQPGDRFLVRLGEGASLEADDRKASNAFSASSYFAVARTRRARSRCALPRSLGRSRAAEILARFAVRAKRSDKSFPHNAMKIEADCRPLSPRQTPRRRPRRARATCRARKSPAASKSRPAPRSFTREKFPARAACRRTRVAA